MTLKKYPVISKSGQTYQVEMFVGESLALAGFNVVIRKQRKGLFGISYKQTLRHFSISKYEEIMFEEYGSYVDIASYFVAVYEDEVRKALEEEERRETYTKEFEEWDGIC